jgi:hypothetical protein
MDVPKKQGIVLCPVLGEDVCEDVYKRGFNLSKTGKAHFGHAPLLAEGHQVLQFLEAKPTPEEVVLVPVSAWAGRLQTPKEVLHALRSAQGVAKPPPQTKPTHHKPTARCRAEDEKIFRRKG